MKKVLSIIGVVTALTFILFAPALVSADDSASSTPISIDLDIESASSTIFDGTMDVSA